MTQADSATALRRSLDSHPTPGQGQVITAKTPLPPGWGSFCSKAEQGFKSRWYATAPWDLISLMTEYGSAAQYLAQTVVADTWDELHKKVTAQDRLYTQITSTATEK